MLSDPLCLSSDKDVIISWSFEWIHNRKVKRKMTRILFVNAINECRKKEVETRHPNLGILYLASYLKAYSGFNNVKILQIGSITEQILKSVRPDIIGVSSITQHFKIAKKLCVEIKRISDVPIIIGGYHISSLPNNLTTDMDVGVVGEGEETMLELANAYEANGLDKNCLGKVKGVVFRSSGKLTVTSKRELIRPLDKIPFPARELVHFDKDQVHCMITSRGCPYRCVFCSSSAFWGTTRYFSPEYVAAELREIWRAYHPKVLGFADDVFAVDKKRLKQIASLIKKEDFWGSLSFTCSARANLVDRETTLLLKEIGVFGVSMGLESGSERVLKYLKSSSVTVEQNKKAIDTLIVSGLKPTATFIIGSPTETRAEMQETLDFIKHSKLASFETYVLLPLPNTLVWDEAKVRGIVRDDMDWDRFEIYFEDIPESRVILSELDRGELSEMLQLFQREAHNRLAKRMAVQGILHPLKALEFVKKKFEVWKKLRSPKLGRKVRAYLKYPDRAMKKFCWMLLGRVPPLGNENYDWHWNYLSFKQKTILDLGADYGSTADYFLRNGGRKVVAVEGNENYAKKFSRLLGNDKRITYIHKWISSGKDIDLLISRFSPDIVKVDIEGEEKFLLDVNVGEVNEWLIETHTEQLYQTVRKFFVQNGFKVFTVEYGKMLNAPHIKVLIAKA